MKRYVSLIVAVLAVAADQISKWYFAANYQLYESHNVLGSLVKFTYIHNYGAVGGMLAGAPWIFNIITVAVVLFLIFLLAAGRVKSSLLRWAFTLVVSGGIGNMIDRLSNGYVVDFIDCNGMYFPWIFNIADSLVVIGCGLILLYYLLDTVREIRAKRGADNAET